MNNPVWEWLIRSKLSAYSAAQEFREPSASEVGPGWCFDRFGQSATSLPDGRTVLIGGEHEDYYDPDFHIYNDVVVQHPNGGIDIYGYPAEFFPPTDFHSATLVDNRIIIIGTLGYSTRRQPGITQILTLDVATMSISTVKSSGISPGWIHKHEAVLEEGKASILIRGGKIYPGDKNGSLVENIDDWRLNLADWRWERLTKRDWHRCEIIRRDGRHNHLWEIQQAVWSREVNWIKELEEHIEDLTEALGTRPDLELAERLFCPPIAHEKIPEIEGEYKVVRIRVDGVVVRYVTDTHSIQVTVEGTLPIHVIEALTGDLCAKMTALENSPFEKRQII